MSYRQLMNGLMVAVCALLALVGQAKSQEPAECRVGCNTEKRDCMSVARVSALACKEACRAETESTELGVCMRGCMETFRSDGSTCREDHSSCREVCKGSGPGGDGTPPEDGGPPPDKESKKCLAGCSRDLASCGRDAVKQSKECVQNCKHAADRVACLQGCVAVAKEGGGACGPAFETCVDGCNPPTPTETPSGGGGEGG